MLSEARQQIANALNHWKMILIDKEGELEKAKLKGWPNAVSEAYGRVYRVQRIIVELENAYAESGIMESAERLTMKQSA